jgi:PAS domain S-box-containing protein
LRELIEALPAAVYVTDASGYITYYNAAAVALWGLRPELGKTRLCGCWKVYWSDGTPMDLEDSPMAIALREKRPVRGIEAAVERPDGTRVPFIPFPTPLFDASGKMSGLVNMLVDISERKKAEQALADRNAQLDIAGRIALVGCFVLDPASGKMQVSPGYAAIHGLPEGTVETSRSVWRTRVPPEDAARVEDRIKRATAEGRRELFLEYRVVHQNGELRWIESRSRATYDRAGVARRVVGANIDVTDRKQAEAVLKESEARLADALAAGDVMAFEWDARTGQSRRSGNARLILGDDQGWASWSQRNDFLRRVHPDDRERFKAHIHDLDPDNPSYAASFRFCGPDGREVWLEEAAKGEFDSEGRLVRIKGLTRNISERKTAELALAERTLQMALAERAALVGSLAYDVETEIMQVSAGYAAIHGFPAGTTEVARSKWLASVHPEDRTRLNELRERAFRKRASEYSLDYRIVRSGGEVRWIDARIFVSYQADGSPKRVVGVDIDVTGRKRAEEHQRALVAELDHRVKNVLATVSTVAAHTMDTSSSMAHFVAALDGRIRSMASTHELLSRRKWQGIPLADLLRRELAPYASNGNIGLRGPDVLLSAEAGQTIALVLHELSTNAAKYGALSKKGGRVAVDWRRARNRHGPGWLAVDWVETGVPPMKAPKRSGYGTAVITELVPYELGGFAQITFGSEGVRCRLDIPDQWIGTGRHEGAGAAAEEAAAAPAAIVAMSRHKRGREGRSTSNRVRHRTITNSKRL